MYLADFVSGWLEILDFTARHWMLLSWTAGVNLASPSCSLLALLEKMAWFPSSCQLSSFEHLKLPLLFSDFQTSPLPDPAASLFCFGISYCLFPHLQLSLFLLSNTWMCIVCSGQYTDCIWVQNVHFLYSRSTGVLQEFSLKIQVEKWEESLWHITAKLCFHS